MRPFKAWWLGLAFAWAATLASCMGSEPGRLANPGLDGNRIKATLFFPGQARDGTSPYGCTINDERGLYTVYPQDERHLLWADDVVNRRFVLQQMVQSGVNLVLMSTWGEDFLGCDTAWAKYAPMQDAPQAQDELFAAARDLPLVIVPFIESRGDWTLRAEFPTATDGQVAPGAISQIENLIQRYLKNPEHPEWAQKWARLYDRSGEARYTVAFIHAASDRLGAGNNQAFAVGFDVLAEIVEEAMGVKVGFLLDTLPPASYAPGVFRPSPKQTGPFLIETESVLGINCFIPEIWIGSTDTDELLAWKRDFVQEWAGTTMPVLADVSPGYDAHRIFGEQAAPPYGYTPDWRWGLAGIVADLGIAGMTYNSWNGYTEGMAAVPTLEAGSTFYEWLAGLPPFAVPGRIEAVLFDGDGEGISYHAGTPGNRGGGLRHVAAEIETCADIGGGYNLGLLSAGDWFRYTVNVVSNGIFTVEARVSSPRPGGRFHVEFHRGRQTHKVPFVIPQTGGWHNWRTIRRDDVALSAGQQELRVVMDRNAPGLGVVGDLHYLYLRPSADSLETEAR